MTTTYESGSTVPGGYYLDAASWHVAPVAETASGSRPGGRWTRIPTALAVALAPVLGAAFVVFLPVIGIYVTLQAIASVDGERLPPLGDRPRGDRDPRLAARRGALHRQERERGAAMAGPTAQDERLDALEARDRSGGAGTL